MQQYNYLQLDSTNNEAWRLLNKGTKPPFVIIAESQICGKGKGTRKWISDPGNVFASIALATNKENITTLPQLSFVAALAIGNSIKHFIKNADIKYKWPNDVLLNDKKICGILLESTNSYQQINIVVGIGVNINSYPDNVDFCATSLNENGIICGNSQLFIEILLKTFDKTLKKWQESGFPKIRKEWLANAFALNKEIKLAQNNEVIRGFFTGIDEQGALLIKKADGNTDSFYSADIYI